MPRLCKYSMCPVSAVNNSYMYQLEKQSILPAYNGNLFVSPVEKKHHTNYRQKKTVPKKGPEKPGALAVESFLHSTTVFFPCARCPLPSIPPSSIEVKS